MYPGDLVETARGAQAVLAFRDESRITLGSQTRFRVDNFVYDDRNAGDGRFLASILRGSVRALTGLIGKANHRNVGFSTSTATIGVRGTGFDVVCTGPCANETASFGSGDGLTASMQKSARPIVKLRFQRHALPPPGGRSTSPCWL